jgi:hypothetical protein
MSLQIDHSAAGDFENHVAKPAIPRADLAPGRISGARARVPLPRFRLWRRLDAGQSGVQLILRL